MKRVILFSPNGYVGGFLKEGLQKEKGIQLFTMTRDSNRESYSTDYDILIYSAAVTSVRQELAQKYVQDNVVTAVHMMDFCKRHHIERIIYFSSDEIYGELNTDRVTARTIMVNPNLYAATKYLAEKIVIESGIPYYIMRLPGIVGRVWGKNFIYSLMDRIKNNEPVELYNLDRQFNNIVDIDDLVRFSISLCNEKNREESAVFILGNRESIQLIELVSYIKNLYQSTSSIYPIDAEHRRYFTLDVSEAVKCGYRSKGIRTIMDDLYQIQGGSDRT